MDDKKTSPITPIPLQIVKPEADSGHTAGELQLAAVSPFRLSDDWLVEEVPRRASSRGNHLDKYYHEQSTGRRFRSLVAVKRYLSNKDTDMSTTPGTGSQEMQLLPYSPRSSSSFTLPDDWNVEEKQRSNINYSNTVDKTYIEPGTGNRFRSLRAVERYLTGTIEDTTPLKLSSASGSRNKNVICAMCSAKIAKENSPSKESTRPLKHSGAGEETKSEEELEGTMTNFNSRRPPMINWVLSGPGGGHTWSPFMDKIKVPESVQKKWSEIFISSVHDDNDGN
ncbi:hypothetical protein UlMin_013510 [Ulmus minor]